MIFLWDFQLRLTQGAVVYKDLGTSSEVRPGDWAVGIYVSVIEPLMPARLSRVKVKRDKKSKLKSLGIAVFKRQEEEERP